MHRECKELYKEVPLVGSLTIGREFGATFIIHLKSLELVSIARDQLPCYYVRVKSKPESKLQCRRRFDSLGIQARAGLYLGGGWGHACMVPSPLYIGMIMWR